MSSRSILMPGTLPVRLLRQSHARRRALQAGSRASGSGVGSNRALSNASSPIRRAPSGGRTGTTVVAGGVAATLAALCVYSLGRDVLSPIQNDAKEPRKKSPPPTADLHSGSETLGVHLWGNNRLKVVAPDAAASSSSATLVKKPRYLNALSGQAFRDLALHESYAVAVTAKGDLLQWGSGFSATADTPTPTLRGQDIVQVALTPNKIYARTKAGKVLIVPASLADQTDTSQGQQLPSISVFWRLLGYHGPGAHFVEMTTANQERKDRKIVAISAGRSHLLALAEDGRALCAAVDEQSNECGQLGGGRLLLSGITSKQKVEDGSATRSTEPPVASDRDIRFDTALKEIPALRNLNIKQMVAGDRHSLALSTEGRVLAWGNNSLGQLGLGTGYSFPTIPAPTEASIASAYPKSSSVKPQALYAGGDTSYFLVERTDLRLTAGTEYTESGDRRIYQDLLAAGNGMYGAMGNGQWNSSGVPVRVKTVSGLQEYNETEQTVQPIPVHSLSISSTHAAVVLSNAVQDLVSKQAFGNDVFVFGHNDNYQLGTGKRSNLSIPQHLPPLPYPVSAETKAKIESQKQSGNIVHEESVHSGTKSHMPHNRLQLASRKDKLEERIVCGYGTTAVYWHTNA